MQVRIALTAEQREAIRRLTGREVKQVTVVLGARPQPSAMPYPLEEISLPMFDS